MSTADIVPNAPVKSDEDMIGAGEARRILGCGHKTLMRLPLHPVNIGTGQRRPTWRYQRAEVEALKKARTRAPGE